MSITIDSLYELFTIKDSKLIRNSTGKEAGTLHNGYIRLRINTTRYYAHRILYMMYHNKYIPENLQVDHIDGNGLNNSKTNLRIVTLKENQSNKTKAKGYCYRKDMDKYVARIMKDGIEFYLGAFDTEEEARAVYLKAKKEKHKIKER